MPIHPTAIVSSDASLSPDTQVGPYAIIEGPVRVGPGTVIQGGAKLMGPLTLGAGNIVHSSAVIGEWPQDRKYKGEHSEVVIGDDNVFREGVTIHRGTGLNTKTVIGSRCYFMVNSHVGHNCVVANDVTLVNGALLGGHVHVDDRAIIGANCAVHQFCRIGRLAMLSNACCANVDVPPFMTSMVTNYVTQLNAVGLRRSGMPKENINAVRKLFQFVFRDAQNRTFSSAIAALDPEILNFPEVQEIVAFCKATKRGVARFQAWSDRSSGGSENGEE